MSLLETVERLLFEGESDALDFKSTQYPFTAATDDAKGELLKDILALANSWRRSDGYILIGVQERKGERADVVGISELLDDASLQQFVNAKTSRPVQFAYTTLTIEGKQIAVVHVPQQHRPVFLNRPFGRLVENEVYVRRGSSTAIARPDEIALMGSAAGSSDEVAIDVFLWDPDRRERTGPTIQSLVLETPAPKDIPDYDRKALHYEAIVGQFPRAEYYRELTNYTKLTQLVSPLWFAIQNIGTAVGSDVRIELTIPGADTGVRVLDVDQYPSAPTPLSGLPPVSLGRFAATVSSALTVQRTGSSWHVSGRPTKVQPKSIIGLPDPIYLGATTSQTVTVQVKAFADNLRSPYETSIEVPVVSRIEKANLARIEELHHDWLSRSKAHQEFLFRFLGDES